MLKTNNNIQELFELERWLYVDGTLDRDRKEFWDNQIKSNSELKRLLNEVQNFSSEVSNKFNSELDEGKFSTIMKNVFEARQRNAFSGLLNKLFFMEKEHNSSSKLKLAFATGILFAVISFILLLQKPSNNSRINPELLVWNDTSFSKTLSGVEFEYTSLTDEKVVEYIQYQLANGKWLRDIVSIENEIDKLSIVTNNKS